MSLVDPTPWLLAQGGLPALRARRALGLCRAGDTEAAALTAQEYAQQQSAGGDFGGSLLRTAGVVVLLCDLNVPASQPAVQRACQHLLTVLESQPGYERARGVVPGSVTTPCDLCGFFGPYEASRRDAEALRRGAAEVNAYRELEPLCGPASPVRHTPRSTLDRIGQKSCYSWGLHPLCYTVEALCRGGHHADPPLQPAVNALLGVQRASGGWCRSLGGHIACSVHGMRMLAAHPALRAGPPARAALAFVASALDGPQARGWLAGQKLFAVLQAVSAYEVDGAAATVARLLQLAARAQQRNGSFAAPCRVEKAAAIIAALPRAGA